MNKQFLISVVAMIVMLMGFGVLVHAVLLDQAYTDTKLFRSHEEQPKYLPFMIISHLCTAVAFVWIYRRGKEDKPFLGQGIRFGLLAAALAVVPKFVVYYAVQPMPGDVVLRQVVFDTLAFVVMGIVVARINK
jgi:uncharacterized BrkB/YihY/UPF0761 family membrane protein